MSYLRDIVWAAMVVKIKKIPNKMNAGSRENLEAGEILLLLLLVICPKAGPWQPTLPFTSVLCSSFHF